jgi:hypothetical protein
MAKWALCVMHRGRGITLHARQQDSSTTLAGSTSCHHRWTEARYWLQALGETGRAGREEGIMQIAITHAFVLPKACGRGGGAGREMPRESQM